MDTTRINASIITIGDELLIGQTIDTNSAWMAQELNAIGIWVKRRVAVGDVRDEIWNALTEESKHSQIVLITGGLGPTADDITKPLLCEYFSGRLVVDEGALQNVKNIFERIIKRPMLESNLKQAEVPDVCRVIQNKRGTAPGMWFDKNDVVFISMPGVPHEMKGMMTDYVLPAFQEKYSLPAVVHRTLLTAGVGESYLAERIKEFEQALPPNIKLAYLPNYGLVKLRLTGTGSDVDAITDETESLFWQLQDLLADVMVINEDKPLEEAIGRMLTDRGKTLATAESCTGGFISSLITAIPGSSNYFMGGVVSYDNNIKQNVLGVPKKILEEKGAVSEETVIEMVKGIKRLMLTDYAIAVSGIMGPGGGTDEKPVGTVWIAVSGKGETVCQKFNLRFDRKRNIELTATNALNALRLLIINEENSNSK
ncbi:MAG: CinA family nicotinamide mononucleotide deamidase-related protein [Segetibacter sp.]|nr:CinA family nicotinamide mononucleotide deamidase-related protein [Segetibacter sp.]